MNNTYRPSRLNKYIWIRKGIHLLAFILPLSYYYFFARYQFILISLILALIAGIIEFTRFKNVKFNLIFYKLVGNLLWQHESKTLTGSTTFIIGVLVSAIFFSKPVVVAVLLFLTLGDTIAYLVGNTVGEIRIFGKKTVEGAVAFLIISIFIAWAIPDIKFWPGLFGAIIACIVELLPWKVDDNLSIPLISGTTMQLLLRFQ